MTTKVSPSLVGHIPVRQTVLAAALDSSGYAAGLSAGSGLRLSLAATATPMVLAYAGGFDSYGAVDTIEQIAADDSDIIESNLPASNTSFIHKTFAGAWGSTLVPPQYGYAFDRSKGALLNFEGADASTTILDDFGNTWTANANAQIDTAQSKFGSSSLLLDGTGDYVSTTNITTLGGDSWQAECWFRLNATSGTHELFNMVNAGFWGMRIFVDHNAGNRRLRGDFSSNGSSNDIGSANGTTTTIALNTWYKVRVIFDALAGSYKVFLSNNGAAESTEITIASTARISAGSGFFIGATVGGAGTAFNGWVDGFRFTQGALNTSAETPSASAPAITDHAVHFFSIPEMKMYEVTSASGSAGTNPGMTRKDRVFVGEADTGAATVSAVRNYALRGQYIGTTAFPAAGAVGSFSHNIGVTQINARFKGRVKITVSTTEGYIVGAELDLFVGSGDQVNPRAASVGAHTRLTSKIENDSTGNGGLRVGAVSGSYSSLTTTLADLVLYAKRDW